MILTHICMKTHTFFMLYRWTRFRSFTDKQFILQQVLPCEPVVSSHFPGLGVSSFALTHPDLKKKTYTQKLKIPRSLKLLSVKGHWNSFCTIYGQITYWNSNFLFSNLRLVILNNIVYTFYNAKLFAVLPCFHLKQNGLNQVIVTQTSAVFLHMENSYYSGEAVYQEGKKKWTEKHKSIIYMTTCQLFTILNYLHFQFV